MARRTGRSGASGARTAAQTKARGKSRRAATQAKARARAAEQAATARILGLPVAKPVARPARPVAKLVAKPVAKPVVSPARPVSTALKPAPVTPTKAATPTSAKPASVQSGRGLARRLGESWQRYQKIARTQPKRHPDCKSDTVACGHIFCEHCYPPGLGPCS